MTTRPAAVASMFYPGVPSSLKVQIHQDLDVAPLPKDLKPKALIVPHAGFIYSGLTAAFAYKCLMPYADQISEVVILGPSHRIALHGMATSTDYFFETPLGTIPLVRDKINEIERKFRNVKPNDSAHSEEHSLEVQLPFLQEVLTDFKIIPIVVGQTAAEKVAEVIEYLWGEKNALIVISSDLSHFLSYSSAQKVDLQTAEIIESFDHTGMVHESACGYFPVNGLLYLAKKKKMKIHRLDLRNSGDTSGDKSRVVGYGAWAFEE